MTVRPGMTVLIYVTLCSFLLIGLSAKGSVDVRSNVIDAAISEAKLQWSDATRKGNTATLSSATSKLSAFKMGSPSTLAQGKARLLFEEMVKHAEKKILQGHRAAHATMQNKDNAVIAEDLAKELLHTPGSLLSGDEFAKMYQASNCQEVIPIPNCDGPKSRKHRTADGTCNNLKSTLYGAANTPFRRLIVAQYEDGIYQPRGALQSSGSPLFMGPFSPPNPSARIVSVGVVSDRPVLEESHSHLLMQWGQFIDHDLTLTPQFENSCLIGCTFDMEDECAPIPVPLDDQNVHVTRTDPESRGCHPFTRSVPACDFNIPNKMTPREQVNGISSFIDGSQIYSSNDTIMNMYIRDPDSMIGLLRTGPPINDGGKPSLPFDTSGGLVACVSPNTPCYLAGDVRVNEQTALIVLHTIWMREHNRIATELHRINPHWDSDKLFLVTREIVGAELQKITFKEYLPAVLGDIHSSLISDYSAVGYDERINPAIPNAFATAAFRFGHSQIRPFFDRLDRNYQQLSDGPLNLVDAFFNPNQFKASGGTDPILRGLITNPARKVDEFLTTLLTNQLFASNSTTPGMDLASLNIQRGRDHGIPPYLTWKRWAQRECGISSDFNNELTKIYLLQTYGTLETVDLFVGGLAEKPLQGGLVGATFACIFSKTFESVRNGDRFYYENADPQTAFFTPQQRAEIEKVLLSRIICDNADDIKEIQKNPFVASDDRIQCTDTNQIPVIDLSVWKEESLPETCYLKIRVENEQSGRQSTFTAVSRLVSTLKFHFVKKTSNDVERCIAIRCPEQGDEGQSTKVVVFPSGFRQKCSKSHNPLLPPSRSPFPGTYLQYLSVSHITGTSGIYNSSSSCASGSESALKYTCSSRWTQDTDKSLLVQSLENMLKNEEGSPDITSIEKDISSDDPLFESLPAEIRESLLGDSADPSKEDGQNNLIGLLQSILGELKSKNKIDESKASSALAEELESVLAEN